MKKVINPMDGKVKEAKDHLVHFYSELEERFNIITHGIGFIASIVGAYFLLTKAYPPEAPMEYFSYIIYSFSLIILYGASTLYHSAKNLKWRRKLNIIDHAAIFLLIAGSYTPFTIITLKGTVGWSVFAIVWIIALIGIIFKLFFTGRFEKLSTAMFIIMGWLGIFVINPLIAALTTPALILLFAGGIFYSLGAVFFSLKKIRFNHAIFHVFVIAGSISHYFSIYFYV